MITLSIGNLGVGPAKLESFEVWYDGKPVSGSDDLLRACCVDASAQIPPETRKAWPIITSSVVGRVLRAGQTIPFLSWAKPANGHDTWSKLDKERFKLTRRICYCSVFDECWTSELETTKVTPVDACPAVERMYRD